MPFIQVSTFNSGDPVVAADMRSEWDVAREYTNGLIDLTDFDTDTLETQNILRPDLVWTDNRFTQTWRFTSGLVHSYNSGFYAKQNENAVFNTNHTKNAYFSSRVEYQDVSDLGVQIQVQHTSVTALVKVYAYVSLGFNDVQSDDGNSNAFYLFINGIRQDETVSYASYAGVGAGTPGTPDKTDSDVTDRFVPVRFIYSGTLLPGTYNFQVKCDPLAEYSVCRLRHFFLEVIN